MYGNPGRSEFRSAHATRPDDWDDYSIHRTLFYEGLYPSELGVQTETGVIGSRIFMLWNGIPFSGGADHQPAL